MWFTRSQHRDFKNTEYSTLYNKFQIAVTRGYAGTLRDWIPPQSANLTDVQLQYKNRPNSVFYIKRAELDGSVFTSTEWSEGKQTDNSFITTHYTEESKMEEPDEVLCIGRIKFMFIARMSAIEPEQVVIGGDWYDIVGENPVSKNVQVQFNPDFESENLAFLRDCTPKNLILVPSNPWNDASSTSLMDVLDD